MASPVEFIRKEVSDMLPMWERIRAAIEGEKAVKALGEKVLPKPNPTDFTAYNTTRYEAYRTRVVWYGVSRRTLDGMTGYVFAKEPTVNLPTQLTTLEKNVNGSGVTILQLAKESLRVVLGLGRGGLLVDYPTVDRATTQADIIAGYVAPTILLYQPEQVVNWRESHVGARTFLDLLVLCEAYMTTGDNEFETCEATQYRVLTRNKETGVTGRIYRKTDNGYQEDTALGYQVKGKDGKPLKEIPWTFLGAVNNDSTVDVPPLLDLVELNFAHFRNSADWEETCFMIGQPTPWISGLSERWVTEVLKGAVHLGSRAIIPLPVGGMAGLLQAAPNTLPFEAMKHKELQMVALGAKLVEQSTVQRTATEAGLDHSSEVSVLTAAATNVFLGFHAALTFCGLFVGSGEAKIEFELSEPLTRDILTPEQAAALTALWQAQLIDFEEARDQLKSSGVAWKPDDEVRANTADEGLRPPPVVPGKPAPAIPYPKPPAPK